MKNLVLAALTFSTAMSTALASTNTGILKGTCLISEPGKVVQTYAFTVTPKDQVAVSKEFKIQSPLKGTDPDRYYISAENYTDTSAQPESNGFIRLSVAPLRVFCNPPRLPENGHPVIQPCSRPDNWETLSAVGYSVHPDYGQVLSINDQTEQIAVSCRATFVSQ